MRNVRMERLSKVGNIAIVESFLQSLLLIRCYRPASSLLKQFRVCDDIKLGSRAFGAALNECTEATSREGMGWRIIYCAKLTHFIVNPI